MIKFSKVLKSIAISGLLIVVCAKTASAFLPIPPMPGEPVFDGLNFPNKAISVLHSGYSEAQTAIAALRSQNLKSLKGSFSNLNTITKEGKQNLADFKGAKMPGNKEFAGFNVNGVKVDKGSTDENQYREMYHALFFTYPSEDSEGEYKYDVLKTAYKHKKDEYKQDVIVDTYLKARFTEDYLVKVDETILRLEQCVIGEKEGSECIFFGMQVAKPSSAKNNTDKPDENGSGHMGAVMNAYVVSTVYDRLLRIVEDLTAAEAIFRASQQIDLAKPVAVSEAKESNAAEYIDNGMRFVYNSSHDNFHAKSLLNGTMGNFCKDGKVDPRCPSVNKDKTTLKSVTDSSILLRLKQLDSKIEEAIEIHNMKSRLNEYKTMYLQYLTFKEIHDKALNTLKVSDTCVVNFLDKHSPEGKTGAEIWYGKAKIATSEHNKYDMRQGLSGELIKKYNEKSAEITIGEGSGECKGYYEVCPENYEKVEDESCTQGTQTYYRCSVKIVELDADDTASKVDLLDSEAEQSKFANNWKDTDGFMDGSDSETIQNDNRKETELTWNIGRDGILKIMEDGAKFNLWNDQKVFQAEYLRNKYRNLRLIVEATDQGSLSYGIGSNLAANKIVDTPDIVSGLISRMAKCKKMEDAIVLAKQKYCNGKNSDTCTVIENNGNIVTTKYFYKNGKKEIYAGYPISEPQKVSQTQNCTYETSSSLSENSINEQLEDICFTPTCMIQKFYPTVFGKKAENIIANKNRTIATDKLAEVISTRQTQETILNNWLRKQVSDIENKKLQVTNQKKSLKDINEKIDATRKNKNKYKKAYDESSSRLATIDNEIQELQNRWIILGDKEGVTPDLNSKDPDEQSIARKMQTLNTEKDCINSKISDNNICTKYIKNTPDAENKFMRLSDIEKFMREDDVKINSYTERLETYKKIIDGLEEEVSVMTSDFADEYIVKATAMQIAIETSNDEFENFLEDKDGNAQPYRMLSSSYKECYKYYPLGLGCKKEGPGRLTTENTATTLTNVMHDNGGRVNDNILKNTIKEELESKFFNKTALNNLFNTLNISEKIYVDNSYSELLGGAGYLNTTAVINKIKEELINIAANEIATIINNSDDAAKDEVDQAKEKIKGFTDIYSLSGNPLQAPNSSIYDPKQYSEIRKSHMNLIKKLRQPSNSTTVSAGITDLSEIFGIPEADEMKSMLNDNSSADNENKEEFADAEYFVGLPARGKTYKIKEGNSVSYTTDNNAGREFLAPMSPMTGLPPLREVFYFSAVDYDEVPQKDGKPVISHLLGCKYADQNGECLQEYLPEIWLQLLARPNLRADGKYQQTFIERSFTQDEINNLVRNQLANMAIPGAKDEHYRTIIGRSGVYPCKTDNGVIVDIDGGDDVKNMQFMKRNSAIGEILPICREVSVASGKLTHKLADHGKDGVVDSQALKKVSSALLYENYSELGQLLTVDLKYRPLQQNIQKYLLDNEDANKAKNDISRQKAERASFKRNVMGTFLDAAIAEDKANKALIQVEKNMRESFETLCNKLEALDIHTTDVADTKGCVDKLMQDNLKELSDEGINCTKNLTKESYYTNIFCAIDAKKDEKLSVIQKDRKGLNISDSDRTKIIVKEQLENIDKNISSLTVDSDEYVIIRPEELVDKEKVIQAKVDNELVHKNMEEGFNSMKNQTQSVAYCPRY